MQSGACFPNKWQTFEPLYPPVIHPNFCALSVTNGAIKSSRHEVRHSAYGDRANLTPNLLIIPILPIPQILMIRQETPDASQERERRRFDERMAAGLDQRERGQRFFRKQPLVSKADEPLR